MPKERARDNGLSQRAGCGEFHVLKQCVSVVFDSDDLRAALREQDLPELAAEIAPDWDLPTKAVQSGLETLRSHLELVQGNTALLYEML